MRKILSAAFLTTLLLACSPASQSSSSAAETHDHGSMTAPATASASPAAPRTFPGKMVPIASALGGGTNGYLSLPSSAGRHPAVIVIHEWWGLSDWIRESTDHFAGDGYVALAVDLYHGKSTSDPSEAHELMRGLPEDRAAADLKGAFDTLAKRPDVDPARIGVVGWCMGGGYSLGLALGEPRLAATVINYGRLVLDPKAIAAIRSPILGNFGGQDRGIPADDVKKFAEALTAARIPNDIKIYPEQGHGFMNPGNQAGYSAEAAKDAWGRIDSFFAKNLKDRS